MTIYVRKEFPSNQLNLAEELKKKLSHLDFKVVRQLDRYVAYFDFNKLLDQHDFVNLKKSNDELSAIELVAQFPNSLIVRGLNENKKIRYHKVTTNDLVDISFENENSKFLFQNWKICNC